MVSSAAKTIEDYLAALPAERREVIAHLRQRILKHLPAGYEEMMLWGMPVYAVPLSRYPNTYNGQPLFYAALAAQKNAYSLYLNMAYGNNAVDQAFRAAYAKAGKRLDMGKSCVRFKKLDDLLLDAVDQAIASTPLAAYLEGYERVQAATKTGQRKAAAASKSAKAKAATSEPSRAKSSTAKSAATGALPKKAAVKKAATKTGTHKAVTGTATAGKKPAAKKTARGKA